MVAQKQTMCACSKQTRPMDRLHCTYLRDAPRFERHVRRALALFCLGLLSSLMGGCSFDDSDLDTKTACNSDLDCVVGRCIARECRVVDDHLPPTSDVVDDLGGDAHDADMDPGVPDACTNARNACGGCSMLSHEVGDACGDACAQWVCDGPDAVACAPGAVNACGTCAPLDRVIGSSCGECGTWQCSESTEETVCADPGRNLCGGCAPLEADPGALCGECDATWECGDDDEHVVCDGPGRNVCGGCGGDPGAIVGAACACIADRTAAPPIWTCVDQSPACINNNETPLRGGPNEVYDANHDAPIVILATLHDADDVDWYRVRVRNQGLFETVFPSAQLSNAVADSTVCVYWEFDDGRSWSAECPNGRNATVGSARGCCSTNTSTSSKSVTVRRAGSLDGSVANSLFAGPGTIHAHVYSPSGDHTCEPYRLEIRF